MPTTTYNLMLKKTFQEENEDNQFISYSNWITKKNNKAATRNLN